MRRLFFFPLFFSFMFGLAYSAEALSSSLDETIDALITLFEARDYRTIVLEYSHPDTIAAMEKASNTPDPAERRQEAVNKLVLHQEEFGGMTLKRLKEAKDMKPAYLNNGRDALFDFGGGYFLRFRKNNNGEWCFL